MRIISYLKIMSKIDKSTSYSRLPNNQAVIPRSQSDSSPSSLAVVMGKRQRRGSDWSDTNSILPPSSNEDDDDERDFQVVLRPLKIYTGDHSEDIERKSLLYRRLSKNLAKSALSSTMKESKSSNEVSRSQSVKTTHKKVECRRRHRGSSIPSEMSSSSVKVQHRTVSNRSLPLPGDESEYTRLRNFSVMSKRVINRGDSFRSKFSPHATGFCLKHPLEKVNSGDSSTSERDNSAVLGAVVQTEPVHKVLLTGAAEVGKTSLKNQFMTSEYICAYESSHEDDSDSMLTIVLNSDEAQLEFEEETILEELVTCAKVKDLQPDACVVMYSVTSRRSYLRAKQLLSKMAAITDQKAAVILVGNKTDLVRLRTISTEEGRSLAKEMGCKFIETSVAINHQVDELLVGILTQIRMKRKQAEKHKKRRDSQSRKSFINHGCKASGVLKKILQRACLKSKSCDNLHVL